MSRQNELSGHVALVTGANRGIGQTIALELQRAGAQVVGTATDTRGAEDITTMLNVTASLMEGYQEGLGLKLDLRERDTFPDRLKEIETWAGKPVSLLVNNAGITRDGLVLRMEPDQFDEVISVDLAGPFELTRLVLRGMRRVKSGRVITIGSVAGLKGNAGQANYAAAKAGLVAANQTMVQEFAGRPVTFNVVAPGYIETDMTRGLPQEVKDTFVAHTPARRAGTPQDVANLVRFLASEDASFINGEVIRVDGGLGV
ncbi:SDR family oxidoreductase [Candidatus Saccharibacteria bacterium]|nr:SDR family oxidoreductase [Candidatus Saccharibacteria bacterium]